MSLTLTMPEATNVRVPDRILNNLAAFREWAGDNDLPEKTRTDFYKGEVWVDMGREQVFAHGLLKTKIAATLTRLTEGPCPGYYFCNGVLVTNVAADLSGNPDGTFVSADALTSGRVKLVEGAEHGFTELEGTPDMVLEVVSDSSVTKDNQTLRAAYWEAGIPEYWIADGRGDEVTFDILKRGPKGYAPVRKVGGRAKSTVFGTSFRLSRSADALGHPAFTLEVK